MLLTVSELKKREVIRVCDGKSLGCVTDVRFESCTGSICALCILPDDGGWFSFGEGGMILLPWEKIRCIGDDVILADLEPADCVCMPRNRRKCSKKC